MVAVIDGCDDIIEGCTSIGKKEVCVSSLRQQKSEPEVVSNFHPAIPPGPPRQTGCKKDLESSSGRGTSEYSEHNSTSGPWKTEPSMLYSLPPVIKDVSSTAAALADAGAAPGVLAVNHNYYLFGV